MSVTKNLAASIPGINPAVVSVRVFFYNPAIEALDINAANFVAPAETAAATTATACIFEGWTGKNAGGSLVGRGLIDKGTETLASYYASTDMETILRTEFPPPPPPGN